MDEEGRRMVEEIVGEMIALCPWMMPEDVPLLWQVFGGQVRLARGEVVDVGVMAGALMVLAERAEVAGDRRRAWAFDQWYRWACAALRGEEYHWPELPAALAAVEGVRWGYGVAVVGVRWVGRGLGSVSGLGCAQPSR